MPHVYKISSPTGKVYIGSTIDIVDRFQKYHTLKCKSQTRLFASLVKHGVENHIFQILEECSIEDMRRLEAEYGHKFDVLGKNGMNCRLPQHDDFYKPFSDETLKKMSTARKGKASPRKGKNNSDEHNRKNRINGLGKRKHCKIVVNVQSGIFFDSALDACEGTNYNPGSFVNMLNPNHLHTNKTLFAYA